MFIPVRLGGSRSHFLDPRHRISLSGVVSAASYGAGALVIALALGMQLGYTPVALGAPTATALSGGKLGNPVISTVAPDPTVTRSPSGEYHLYSTSDDWADGGGLRRIPHFSSHDLVDWQYVGDAFSQNPAWVAPGSPLWAPDVVHRGSVGGDEPYILYFATGGAKHCIGAATAPHAQGPWTDLGRPIVCSADPIYPDLDPMDPSVDFSGPSPVMYMGNFEGIHAVELTADGTNLSGPARLVAGTGFEAPIVLRRKGRMHMLLSAGHCCVGENYRIISAVADDPFGPFTSNGEALLGGNGDIALAGNAKWINPGHPSIATDDAGTEWALYHAIPRNDPVLPNDVTRRQMLLDPISYSMDGATIAQGHPSNARTANPVVHLPVRLSAVGRTLSLASGRERIVGVPVNLESTGMSFDGQLSVTMTGPARTRHELYIRNDTTIDANGELAAALPVHVPAGKSHRINFEVELPKGITAGRYELIVHVARETRIDGGSSDMVEVELAPFVIDVGVSDDDVLDLSLGAVGSFEVNGSSFGSSGLFRGSVAGLGSS